jgi:hypothetical protein
MDHFSIFDLPIPIWDLRAIEAVLRGQDMFCTSFPDEDAYSVALYYSQAETYGADAWMILDRNVFARIVELANGRPAALEHQIAAAVIAFAQCAGINFAPAPDLAFSDGRRNGGSAMTTEFDPFHNVVPAL